MPGSAPYRRNQRKSVSVTEFIGRPNVSKGNLVAKFNNVIKQRSTRHVWMITSIAEGTGLRRLSTGLAALREREGMSEAIITTVSTSANAKGLMHATEVIDRRLAIREPDSHLTGTYFYVAEANESATVLLGPPGLSESATEDPHEGGLWIELDLKDEKDSAFLDSLREYFDSIVETPGMCELMGDDLVPELIADVIQPLKELPPLRATGERTGVNKFFKRLSRNDVSLTDSPGQMIIPRRFLSFFPELEESVDKSKGGGSRQRSAIFPLTYISGDRVIDVEGARVILYVPAEGHARRNPEIRFTFRNTDILQEVDEGDYLVFSRRGEDIFVERHDPDWVPPGGKSGDRFGEL